MRLDAVPTLLFLGVSGIIACEGSGTPPITPQPDTGVTQSSGGSSSSSKSNSTASNKGGSKSTSSNQGSGGTPDDETTEGQGGTTSDDTSEPSTTDATGGTKATSSKITSAKGGSTGAGGTKATGGSAAGGTSATGATGGTKAVGGTTAKATTTASGPRFTPSGTEGKTTRYWDCCKPTCAWSQNTSKPIQSCDKSNNPLGGFGDTSGCDGGNAFMCWKYAPFAKNDGEAFAFAARNVPCGQCFELIFTGTSNEPGQDRTCAAVKGKKLTVQVTNTGSDVGSNQFDLLIPGGGVGKFNGCTSGGNQLGSLLIGAQYGGLAMDCNYNKSCVKDACSVFQGKPDLLKGCMWYADWMGAADNPKMMFKQVPCPSELTAVSGISG
jgi:hypothetical protein